MRPRIHAAPRPSREAATGRATQEDVMHKLELTPTRHVAGLAADDDGRSDTRAPLLLLHGLSMDRRMWRPALDALRPLDPDRRALSLDLPGHGESPSLAGYDIDVLVDAVHAAVLEAGLDAPVVVGHSVGGIIATVYTGLYPTRGVINVDQPLQALPFIQLLRSMAGTLHGPGFRAVWDAVAAGFHTEWLPPRAQELVRSMSRPRQDVLLGYWRAPLELPPADIEQWTAAVLDRARAAGRPYVAIAGEEVEPGYPAWLREALPQAMLSVWPRAGHFPHLAHPERFARLLAATGGWPAAPATRRGAA
jgi:pimeloyl-ACP methyl ester carboxylesterase